MEEIPPGKYKTIDINDIMVAVFNIEGNFYAIEVVCTHDGGILTGGSFAVCVIACPHHGAQFAVRTGEVLTEPAYEPITTFPVLIQDGMVQVKDYRWD